MSYSNFELGVVFTSDLRDGQARKTLYISGGDVGDVDGVDTIRLPVPYNLRAAKYEDPETLRFTAIPYMHSHDGLRQFTKCTQMLPLKEDTSCSNFDTSALEMDGHDPEQIRRMREEFPHLRVALGLNSPQKKTAKRRDETAVTFDEHEINKKKPRTGDKSDEEDQEGDYYHLEEDLDANDGFRRAWDGKDWELVEKFLLARSRVRQSQLFIKENWSFDPDVIKDGGVNGRV